jgi:uncharacterized protein YbaP (TraB family)
MRTSRNCIPNTHRIRLASAVALLAFFLLNANTALCQSAKKFLWEVQSPKNTVYLLGSIHVLTKDSYPLPAEFEEAYRESEAVVFETDLDEMDEPKTQELVSRLGLLPPGESLKELISEDTYRQLEKRLAASGIGIAPFERFKPWLCTLVITAQELRRLGFDPQYGLDKYFFDKAKKDGKRIVALETVEEQLHLFADMDRAQQDALLRQTLQELDVTEKLFRQMIDAWDKGNTERIYGMIKESLDPYPDIYRELFVKRNLKWVGKIEKMLGQNGKILVIVGAGHLVGPDGLIALLAAKGLKITQK